MDLSKAELEEKPVTEVGMSTSLLYRLFSHFEQLDSISVKAKAKAEKCTCKPQKASAATGGAQMPLTALTAWLRRARS